jgi:hypothetical protein
VEQEHCGDAQVVHLRVEAPRRPSFEATLFCGETGVTALSYIGRRAGEPGLQWFCGVAEPQNRLLTRYVLFAVDHWSAPYLPPTIDLAARLWLVDRHGRREVDDPAEIRRLRWACHRGAAEPDPLTGASSVVARVRTAA